MKSSRLLRFTFLLWIIVPALLLFSIKSRGEMPAPLRIPFNPTQAQAIPPDPVIPSTQLISPEDLVKLLNSKKPLLLQVGSRSLYQQAHIPGSEYVAAGSSEDGRAKLATRLKTVPKSQLIVLYCGCCPWTHCPNVHPTYELAHTLGYTNVKVLYIANNFGADWVDKGYPTAKGN